MPDRSNNRDEDVNEMAARIVREATNEDDDLPDPDDLSDEEARKLAAKILGRQGGLKGGPARAKKLSAKRRKEIARKAAKARWEKEKGTSE